ncbi:alpha/beta fold hydrolase [uncultured Williamsia sp.]|uniref:esterase/lipase family protein n=1 Tax=uncultured Williamsia sp. TaxID=259311 RepID=UPI002638C26A|nr:alpha/beta fold hydrolase [uncultured Williamsia sp.]
MSRLSTRARRRLCVYAAALVAMLAIPAQAAAAPHPSSGINTPTCRPSAEHPRPVVLVHGTWANPAKTWEKLAPALRDQGFCVYTISYGKRQSASPQNLLDLFGGNSIRQSARTLGSFVDTVRKETGARQVDIVGHSQGDHMGMTSDPRAVAMVLDALDPSYATTHRTPCP